MDIIEWVKDSFPYPHCQGLRSVTQLKSGAVIAEVLTDLLPERAHHMFLPNIQIHNLSVENCINNLRMILVTISSCCRNDVRIFKPEALYYREGDMMKFMRQVVMNLKPREEENYTDIISAHYSQTMKIPNNISDLSQIVNCSSVISKEPPKSVNYVDLPLTNRRPQKAPATECIEPSERGEDIIPIEREKLEKLEKWIYQIGLDPIDADASPESLFGSVVNRVFSSARMSEPIIKQAHFCQGSNSIYRKALEFLLKNPQADKLEKANAMQMLKQIEEERILKEGVYYATLYDLYTFNTKKVRPQSARHSSRSKQVQKQAGQENLCINRKLTSRATIKTVKHHTNNYSFKAIKQTEKWISEDLGYEYSLNRSKTITKVLDNPLLNGSFFGSIVMRLKIGRPNIIKTPTEKKHISKNIDEIMRVCLNRNYKSVRKLGGVEVSYEEYIGILSELKQEYFNKNPEALTTRQEKIEKKPEQMRVYKSIQSKESMRKWVQKRTNTELGQKLTPSRLTQICSQLLNVNIYRETTDRIQDNNLQKILGELRRIGLTSYYLIDRDQMKKDEWTRWRVINDLMNMLDDGVSYMNQ